MKNIVVFGAGLVAKPLVRYLLDHGFQVKVATRTVSKAERIINGHPNGVAKHLLVDDAEELEAAIKEADMAVSLLPYTYHVQVAELCIKHRKNMVTTSYVSDAMRALDGRAKEAGIIILNESGLDPGIDHMSAMKIIHDVEEKGGKVVSFRSYCGGLPAPDANDNPLGYKFSWSPRGVAMAGRNSARWLEDGKEVKIESKDLFATTHNLSVPDMGDFDAYPNRDSVPYVDIYGLHDTNTMFRGTLRYKNWCPTWKVLSQIGMLEMEEMDGLDGMTYRQFMARLIGADEGGVKEALASKMNITVDSPAITNLEWLSLFGDTPLPDGVKDPLDILVSKLTGKMDYKPGERDMIILHHEFVAEYDDSKVRIQSTLVNYGIPDGDSSMSRTVALPAAIGARMILEGKISEKGVHIPVTPDIYAPVLEELEKQGIKFVDRTEPIQ
jgi:saccharopine dehydrogenase (NADP+, L-glutamate forming)/spermidine synthase